MSLDRKLSDHCLVVLKDIELDFGPKPFRFFDVWLQESDIEKVVSFAWALSVRSRRPDCIYRDKLKNVKSALKSRRPVLVAPPAHPAVIFELLFFIFYFSRKV